MTPYSILTYEFPPDKGGVGNFAASIANSLHGQSVQILIDTNAHAHKTTDPRILRVRFFFRWVWPHWLPLVFAIRKQQQAIPSTRFLAMAVLPFGSALYIAKKIFGVRYSLMLHGMDLAIHQRAKWKKSLLKKIISHAESVVTISNFTNQLALTFGAHQSQTAICHPTAYITPITSEEKSETEAAAFEGVYFFSVGRLVKRKNNATLIRAFKKFSETHAAVSLLIAGDGPEYATLKKDIDTLQLQNRVQLLGKVSDNTLRRLYAHARAICFIPTSENGDVEGFGITAIEASAFGRPVIASNQGGVTDAAADGISGISVDPHDIPAIVSAMQLLANADRADELGRKGRERYESQFSPAVFASRIQALLQPQVKDISVVIPMYNGETTIAACIESLLRQTYRPKEIILVDDGSTDATQEICASYKDSCTFIQNQHGGAPAARNTGAKHATGEYLIFVDADCVCKETMLERMHFALESNPQVAYAYSGFMHGWKKFSSFEFNAGMLKKMNYIHTSALMRRAVFPGFDESLKRFQDWDMWLTLLAKGEIGIHIPKTLYQLATKKGNISAWLPSFTYRLPLLRHLHRVSEYKRFESIIKKKHSLI